MTQTVNDFNEAFITGIDKEFGRTNFDNEVDLSAGGPYYASPRSPAVHHTMGGVEININGQVFDVNGNIIKGLWAAGEVTGGIHGTNRIGGNAVPEALSYGRIAGANAAKAK